MFHSKERFVYLFGFSALAETLERQDVAKMRGGVYQSPPPIAAKRFSPRQTQPANAGSFDVGGVVEQRCQSYASVTELRKPERVSISRIKI